MATVSHSLTTRQRLLDFLGVDSTTATEDDVLDRIINAVTAYVENYTGRRIMKTAHSNEVYDGHNEEQIILKNWPVDSDETFTLQYRDSSENEDDWETIDSTDYYVKYDEGIVHGTGRSKWIAAIRKYRVSYTAGYNFDNATTFLSDTVAGDLEYITWKLASLAWNNRQADPNVASESLGDYSVSFMKTVMEDGDVKSVLDKYKRYEMVSVMTPRNT